MFSFPKDSVTRNSGKFKFRAEDYETYIDFMLNVFKQLGEKGFIDHLAKALRRVLRPLKPEPKSAEK